MVRGWIYMIAGAVIALAALRPMVGGAVRDFYARPRRQRREHGGAAGGHAARRPSGLTAKLRQSGVIPDVAPSDVQTRTMSRIDSTPTSSGPS